MLMINREYSFTIRVFVSVKRRDAFYHFPVFRIAPIKLFTKTMGAATDMCELISLQSLGLQNNVLICRFVILVDEHISTRDNSLNTL